MAVAVIASGATVVDSENAGQVNPAGELMTVTQQSGTWPRRAPGVCRWLGFYAASGDSGSDDAGDGGTSVGYPCVTGVGGTRLTVTSSNAWSKEVAWSDGGGGKYRTSRPTPTRAPASRSTRRAPGPRSAAPAAAPEWAAFAALYNQQASAAGKPDRGLADPALYSASGTGFHDITNGSNGACSAATGWDFTTGWGSYNASALASKPLG
ncbi:hypothetical protein BIV25_21670 [Streptomyces sp. MUSC 14]|uniref:hypothetical protein n=1 Tax=Streptomyces sp. MUSC 14 TaxID=1354889 RepID=UPI0008F5B699|nr:hypothetical protein [Streptomyces sp. MUSC 14]OIJ94690.1 hypothetical protein BIV25_21670 [Streptomyces sp. MUSC 14]